MPASSGKQFYIWQGVKRRSGPRNWCYHQSDTREVQWEFEECGHICSDAMSSSASRTTWYYRKRWKEHFHHDHINPSIHTSSSACKIQDFGSNTDVAPHTTAKKKGGIARFGMDISDLESTANFKANLHKKCSIPKPPLINYHLGSSP